ncbi:cytochrome C552 [Aquimarina sp. BL5]|uniref:c-type cytochrome n=1 Tax=Aquimarina sp. BL5 TaxID=1714860 RepID=UPI000E4850DA|nr:c-type cytochrome [Aquimarina sp. BL5]AXT51851.1 cytochrome C552 [Aquimarina sp. BL5]RKM99822.1 cytochrome C552 [Aquimarina sp. BL5]
MKNIFLILLSITFIATSCQSEKKPEKEKIVIGSKKKSSPEFDLGKELFKGKGNCYSCHRMDKKSIGPSVTEIMKIYKEKNGDIIGFLRQKKDPIVDPDNYAVMKTNFARLEKFTNEELKAIELYMNEATAK